MDTNEYELEDEFVKRRTIAMFGQFRYDAIMKFATEETRCFFLDGEFIELNGFVPIISRFFSKAVAEGHYMTLAGIKMNIQYMQGVDDNMLVIFVAMLNIFFYLKDCKDEEEMRLRLIYDSLTILDVPYEDVATTVIAKKHKFYSMCINKKRSQMLVQVAPVYLSSDRDPVVEALIDEIDNNLDFREDYFLSLDEVKQDYSDVEAVVSDHYDSTAFTSVYYQSVIQVSSIITRYECPESGESNEILRRVIARASEGECMFYRRINRWCFEECRRRLVVLQESKNWYPDRQADYGWHNFRNRCAFHYDLEDCGGCSYLEGEEWDIACEIGNEGRGYHPSFVDYVASVDVTFFSKMSRSPGHTMAITLMQLCRENNYGVFRRLFHLGGRYGLCDNHILEVYNHYERQAKKDVAMMVLRKKIPKLTAVNLMDRHPALMVFRSKKGRARVQSDDVFLGDSFDALSAYYRRVDDLYVQGQIVCVCGKEDCSAQYGMVFCDLIPKKWEHPVYYAYKIIHRKTKQVVEYWVNKSKLLKKVKPEFAIEPSMLLRGEPYYDDSPGVYTSPGYEKDGQESAALRHHGNLIQFSRVTYPCDFFTSEYDGEDFAD